MVLLADKMRQKLLSSNSNQDEVGSKEEMQDWFLSVGIASPVTKESAGALYHQQLSRQVTKFSTLLGCLSNFIIFFKWSELLGYIRIE